MSLLNSDSNQIEIKVISVDVGNGDCSLVLFKNSMNENIYSILIDAGYGRLNLKIILYFRNQTKISRTALKVWNV